MNRPGSLFLSVIALLCVAAKGGCDDSTGPAVDTSAPDAATGLDAGVAETGLDGACVNHSVCSLPVLLPGCSVGVAPCVNGIRDCPPVVCPDAGAPTDSGTSTGTSTEGGPDSGGFTCDSGDGSPLTCDGQTQACKIVNGGAYPGIHAPACVTLPAGCQTAPTCACVEAALSASGTCVERGGNFTVTEDVP